MYMDDGHQISANLRHCLSANLLNPKDDADNPGRLTMVVEPEVEEAEHTELLSTRVLPVKTADNRQQDKQDIP